jgi:hypothetical protein
MKNIRVATINNNDPDGPRVKLTLNRATNQWGEYLGYTWHTEAGEDCCMGYFGDVTQAEKAAIDAWGAPCWDLRATWR